MPFTLNNGNGVVYGLCGYNGWLLWGYEFVVYVVYFVFMVGTCGGYVIIWWIYGFFCVILRYFILGYVWYCFDMKVSVLGDLVG